MKTEVRMNGLESDFGYESFGAEASTAPPSISLQLAPQSAPIKHFSLFDGILLILGTAALCFSPQIYKGVKKQKFVRFGKR